MVRVLILWCVNIDQADWRDSRDEEEEEAVVK